MHGEGVKVGSRQGRGGLTKGIKQAKLHSSWKKASRRRYNQGYSASKTARMSNEKQSKIQAVWMGRGTRVGKGQDGGGQPIEVRSPATG